MYLATKHFRHFIEGREFHICTDHKPLIFALDARADRHSPRQIRHLDFIAQFTSDIRYIKGTDNAAADALSRVVVNAMASNTSSPVDFHAMALAQKSDPELNRLKLGTSATDVTLICDTFTGSNRSFVPETLRRSIFDSLHGLAHPGIRASQKLLTTRYVWPGINSDVRRWTRACLQCQRSKVQRHNTAPLIPFSTPDVRFYRVHLDLVGPFPPSKGYSYLLTCIDCFTRWPEAVPYRQHHSGDCRRGFCHRLGRLFRGALNHHHRSRFPV